MDEVITKEAIKSIKQTMNIPVYLGEDKSKVIGYADLNGDGTATMTFKDPKGVSVVMRGVL